MTTGTHPHTHLHGFLGLEACQSVIHQFLLLLQYNEPHILPNLSQNSSLSPQTLSLKVLHGGLHSLTEVGSTRL